MVGWVQGAWRTLNCLLFWRRRVGCCGLSLAFYMLMVMISVFLTRQRPCSYGSLCVLGVLRRSSLSDNLIGTRSSVAWPELARLRAVSQPESGLWLHALPSPQLGTLLDNDSLRVAVALRLSWWNHMFVSAARGWINRDVTGYTVCVVRAGSHGTILSMTSSGGLLSLRMSRRFWSHQGCPVLMANVRMDSPWCRGRRAAVYSGTRRACAPSRRLTCSLQRPMRMPHVFLIRIVLVVI